ncbi:MAG: hypothetical protein ACXWMN_06395, partial [Candidatus Limnocylindria bacterium]
RRRRGQRLPGEVGANGEAGTPQNGSGPDDSLEREPGMAINGNGSAAPEALAVEPLAESQIESPAEPAE